MTVLVMHVGSYLKTLFSAGCVPRKPSLFLLVFACEGESKFYISLNADMICLGAMYYNLLM